MSDAVPASPTCHNCGVALHGRFCAACGQEALPLNPSLYELVREVLHELLDVDGRIFRTVQRLFLSPGFLTREHFNGRRVAWIPPVRLYLIFSVAYFAVVSLGGSTNLRVNVSGGTAEKEQSALRKLGFNSQQELRDAAGEALATWMPRVMFVLVPLFGWLVFLVRRRSGRAYPQHLLFALHAHAAWFGVRAVAAAGGLARPAAIGSVLDALSTFYGIAYVFLGLRAAYGGTARRAVRDTAIVLLIYGATVAAATIAIVLPVVLWRR